ncbi:MAG: shikimate kinase [Chloroflexi bacterium]|nr:shikimate kinase [Chloroflexota bacterium]
MPANAGQRALALIGFMGIGKTTVGGELSRRLRWPLVDTDSRIESQSNMTIREIFDWLGEPHFRDLERELITTESGHGRCVLSLGGGAFVHPVSQQLLLERCTVVYLSAPWGHVARLVSRLKNTRPLLRDRSLPELQQLFDTRHAIYDAAHVRVSVPGRRPPEVARRILELTGLPAPPAR